MNTDDTTLTSERGPLLALAAASETLCGALDALPTCPLCGEGTPHHAEDCPVLAVAAALAGVVGV